METSTKLEKAKIRRGILVETKQEKKVYYDFEFIESPRGIDNPATIEPISVGMRDNFGNELYLISRNFDLNKAWYKIDGTLIKPNFWLRENVLKTLYKDLCEMQKVKDDQYNFAMDEFNQENLSWLLQQHGLSEYQMTQRILEFIQPKEYEVKLYGYYSAYDHVALCWLFGRMIDLPEGMPMYTKDLKQTFDLFVDEIAFRTHRDSEDLMKEYKQHPLYPKLEDEHNALADARWNEELGTFVFGYLFNELHHILVNA